MNGKRSAVTDRRRRRLITLGWSVALLITIVLLISFEQTAILYILATLGVCGILFVVAIADLAHSKGETIETNSEKSDAPFVASSTK